MLALAFGFAALVIFAVVHCIKSVWSSASRQAHEKGSWIGIAGAIFYVIEIILVIIQIIHEAYCLP